jgi:hypothetical protein
MLTHRPWEGEACTRCSIIKHEQLPDVRIRDDIPNYLAELVTRAIAKNRDDRGKARDMLTALRKKADGCRPRTFVSARKRFGSRDRDSAVRRLGTQHAIGAADRLRFAGPGEDDRSALVAAAELAWRMRGISGAPVAGARAGGAPDRTGSPPPAERA